MKTISGKSKGMKILFVYTEFLNNNGESRLYRGFSKLSLNLSTDKYFSYNDGMLTVKKLEKPIVSDFFGDRIYNITSLVGNNGDGKTTILQYITKLLQQIYDGEYYENDFVLLAIEWNSIKCILEYRGKSKHHLVNFPEGFKHMFFNDRSIKESLSTTKLIYLSNTLTNSDLEMVRPQSVKRNDLYVNLFHFRYDFLYNCSTASLMIENCQNDSSEYFNSVSEYLKCFFLYEQYKQVKYVFDKRQYDILKELRGKGYPVPVPNELMIELQCADYYEIFGEQFYPFIEEHIYDKVHLNERLLYELCSSCVESFYKTVRIFTRVDFKIHLKNLLGKAVVNKKRPQPWLFFEILNQIIYEFRYYKIHEADLELVKGLYKNCIDFIKFVYDERKHIEQYFRIDTFNEKTEKNNKRKLTFSINTTGIAAEWFIVFLQKYRYTCEPYYYLNFHWGLSSGEQNLLRMFSSLYYIFDTDFTNPKRGDYKIYNRYNNERIPCDSIMLFLDEADLTYHPEWQRRFISILAAFLPKIYPKSSCNNIQIILTTHSPLMLGDFPAQSVIYLSKDANNQVTIDDKGSHQTFGENLYTLLQNSFSVQNGAVGELVQIKIQEILKTLEILDQKLLTWSAENEKSFTEIYDYKCQLQDYKRSTVAFLADGIIKAKLEIEIDRRLYQLESRMRPQYNDRMSTFDEWSDEQLQLQLEVISNELKHRKEGEE